MGQLFWCRIPYKSTNHLGPFRTQWVFRTWKELDRPWHPALVGLDVRSDGNVIFMPWNGGQETSATNIFIWFLVKITGNFSSILKLKYPKMCVEHRRLFLGNMVDVIIQDVNDAVSRLTWTFKKSLMMPAFNTWSLAKFVSLTCRI